MHRTQQNPIMCFILLNHRIQHNREIPLICMGWPKVIPWAISTCFSSLLATMEHIGMFFLVRQNNSLLTHYFYQNELTSGILSRPPHVWVLKTSIHSSWCTSHPNSKWAHSLRGRMSLVLLVCSSPQAVLYHKVCLLHSQWITPYEPTEHAKMLPFFLLLGSIIIIGTEQLNRTRKKSTTVLQSPVQSV